MAIAKAQGPTGIRLESDWKSEIWAPILADQPNSGMNNAWIRGHHTHHGETRI